ncbi:phage tail protein [Heliobacterium chlorum]|uniref:Phage tail protein n=1 Tax=Heliobacterium chlorum TaxID=2698 RepID=A0ABR7SYQ5_HELCL|nr:phage tail protein [Heliobacterium chlorum]MBC9783556.1 phage tail protein [Heliobacterium chlorum]
MNYIEVFEAGQRKARLSPASDPGLECWPDMEMNGPSVLEITLPLDNEKWQYFTSECRIYAAGREYILLKPDNIELSRDGKKLIGKVTAHESWLLLNKEFPGTDSNGISNDPHNSTPHWGTVQILSGGTPFAGCTAGSAESALRYVMQGSTWTVGTVDVTGTHDLETEKKNRLQNVWEIQKKWGGIVVFDSIQKTVSLRSEDTWKPGYNQQSDRCNFQVRYRKNLIGLKVTESADIVTRLYPFGYDDLNIASVNGGKLYVENLTYTQNIYADVYVNTTIYDPAELKSAAEKQLSKVCKPRRHFQTGKSNGRKLQAGVVDLRTLPGYEHEEFALYQMADLIDEGLGVQDTCRIIRHKWNLFQPWNCELEMGDPLDKVEAKIALSATFTSNVQTPSGVTTLSLDGLVNSNRNPVYSQGVSCIDAEGTLDAWQEGRCDNVDEDDPLTVNLYVPPETVRIHKALLRFRLLEFRAYEKGAKSSGGIVTSSEDGGGVATTTSDEHVDYGTISPLFGTKTYYGDTGNGGDPSHDHDMTHSHDMPVHYHNIEIPEHSHQINIPPHTHELVFGIYKSTKPTSVTIKINGIDRTSQLGGPFHADQTGLDILQFLTIGIWNSVEIWSDRLGRIDATAFLEVKRSVSPPPAE